MKSRALAVFASIVVTLLLCFAAALAVNAWNLLRVAPMVEQIQRVGTPTDLLVWIDLQIDAAREKINHLNPGPPPPWYTPSYYLDWLPKERLYGEAQEKMSQLQKQRRQVIEHGTATIQSGRVVWNHGIAPILHMLLSFTLVLASLRNHGQF